MSVTSLTAPGPLDEERLYWDWYQRLGPGAELLGDVAGATVADLGAGTGERAAHVAAVLGAEQVAAIDTSATRVTLGRERYAHLAELDFVHGDAATYLAAAAGSVDVAYSCFGAADFSDPVHLLPAAASGLRPGGTFVLATLAHYEDGAPPAAELRPTEVSVRSSSGSLTTKRRWVLAPAVWEKLLAEAGFTAITTEVLRDPGGDRRPPIATTLIRAVRGTS
ncbi:class I SAM-dependent methyltransferase [Streptomyces sp. NPDC021224]|uniref:class I SAM-dependent methyltransferase n=1 Tax=unclassified Streptomyces TaxID=2593676 RepID=UPI00379EAF70